VTRQEARRFVKQHGVVLEAGRGPVPSLAEAVAGESIRGSWWGHAKGHEIFWLTRAIRDWRDVLVCRVAAGKITYVHRRLWPALVRLASRLEPDRLAALHEVHTRSGRHELHEIPYPRWVPADVRRAAGRLTDAEAARMLDECAANILSSHSTRPQPDMRSQPAKARQRMGGKRSTRTRRRG